jgi:hypothetical protein
MFPWMKIPPFWFSWGERGRKAAMLNILIDHVIQVAFLSGRSDSNGVNARKGTISRVMMASRPIDRSEHMAAPVPEIMENSGKLHSLEFTRRQRHFHSPTSAPYLQLGGWNFNGRMKCKLKNTQQRWNSRLI